MLHHRIENRQELPMQATSATLGTLPSPCSRRLKFRITELYKVATYQVGANRDQTTPDPPLPAQRPAVTVERRHTDPRSHWRAVQRAPFRQSCQHGSAHHRANAEDTRPPIVLLAPDWALANRLTCGRIWCGTRIGAALIQSFLVVEIHGIPDTALTD